ncbi:hypothetical protein Hanom_Chr09g00857741 [Helianthus anomalus]
MPPLPLFVGLNSSWSDTDENDEHSEKLDDRPSMVSMVQLRSLAVNIFLEEL